MKILKPILPIILLIILYGCYCPDIDENSFSFKPTPIDSDRIKFNTPYIRVDSAKRGKYDSNYYLVVNIFYKNGICLISSSLPLDSIEKNIKYFDALYGVYKIDGDSLICEFFFDCYWLRARVASIISYNSFTTQRFLYIDKNFPSKKLNSNFILLTNVGNVRNFIDSSKVYNMLLPMLYENKQNLPFKWKPDYKH